MPTEDNIYDEVMGEIKKLMLEIRTDFQKKFKHTKPFGVEPPVPREELYEYETRGYDKFQEIANTQGLVKAVEWRDDMEKQKQRLARRGG